MKKVKCTLTQRQWDTLREALRFYGEIMEENGWKTEANIVGRIKEKIEAGSWKMDRADLETIQMALEAQRGNS